MKKLITAFAAASMLLAGPALADRAGHQRNQATGSAFDKAYSKQQRESHREKWRGADKKKEFKSSHRPARQDRDHRDRDRREHRGGKHDKRDHNNANKKGYKNGHRDSRKHDKRDYRRGYKDGYKRSGHKGGHKYSGHGGHGRPHYNKYKHKPAYGYHGKRHKRYHKHYWRPSHYHYGYRWRQLPRNFVRISFGGLGLFYSDGVFYRPHDYGYVVAPAPVGAIIHSLPGSAFSVVFGGRNYYVAYDTYYLWDGPSRGYRVVANPGFY